MDDQLTIHDDHLAFGQKLTRIKIKDYYRYYTQKKNLLIGYSTFDLRIIKTIELCDFVRYTSAHNSTLKSSLISTSTIKKHEITNGTHF